MSSPLLITKLIPSQPRPDFVPRPRLIRRIANPKRGRVTLITAPAGYGKTSLLAEWCSTHKGQIAWLALDPADNDGALFWSYAAGGLGVRPSREAVPDVNTLINTLANERRPLTFVLDDLHVIRSKRLLSELARFIERAPAHVQFVLAARSEPALPLASWRARGELNELRARDLAFTAAETRAFLQGTMRSGMSEELMARLGKVTEGWAAALQLAALANEAYDAGDDLEVPGAFIFEYFANEVLAQQPRTRQKFLLETSVLTRVSGELADALTGRRDGARQLEELRRANLFITGPDAQEKWYRYHPLFAEFLQKRLMRTDSARLRVLHQRAGQWFSEHGLYAEAIEHALQARDFQNASTWIDAACETAMQRGQLATMLGWLDALPPEIVALNTFLNLWYGWVLCLTRRYEAMELHLRAAEKRAAQLAREQPCWASEREIVRGKVAAIRAQAAILQNDDEGTLKWSRVTLERLPERFPRERSTAWLNRARALERCGKLGRANEAFEQAAATSRAADHPFIHFNVLYEHARFQLRQGRPEEAQTLLCRALALAKKEGVEEWGAPAQELLDKVATERRDAGEALSAREHEILQWLARGESNSQIAARIGIGVGTVNWHTKNIYKKLGVKNRTQAAAYVRADKEVQ